MVEPKILEYIENLLLDYLENDNIEVRKCDVCNSYMIEGYCIEEGTSYYCTDECMLTEMTIEEFNNLYADGEEIRILQLGKQIEKNIML